ncbi:flagellar type III secretion system protein FlhB [Cognatishimia sp. SS12]|uniref:EscU/YscU/HrcU family type III secretion system export apparatus switch protein n=1 Tax=Cognatishimia sp. SS12 TaxID=2979465 RepID=UPI00232F861C|nr:flagellar type III secretion system protein FlhB [Cognatishimia sp. SS12]MDC0739479.1 flagellar type III secretion system protein FlhB [Cognatishimia sp. SS12]
MAEEDQSSKSQEPTEKKLRDARKKGDVPNSRETGNMMVVVAMIGIVTFGLQWQTPELVAALSTLIDNAGRIHVGVERPGVATLGTVFWEFIGRVSVAVAPIFGLLLAGALFGVLIQGETVAAVERIKPKLSKVSIKEGLKRQFSANTLVDFVKNLLKVLVVGGLALWVTNTAVRGIWQGPGFVPETLPGYMADATRKLLIAAAAFLVPVAIFDILWRRYDWRRKQMMSMKEVRDEMKESEGDPLIRGKRAALRRQRAQQRIAMAVPTANVILTNPTHFAVALRYEQGVDVAPICVAKGADVMARQIRLIAHDNEIPIVENKPLARTLFDVVEVDDAVPVEHWELVAEIISFVMALQRDPKRKPPAGSSLRTDRD